MPKLSGHVLPLMYRTGSQAGAVLEKALVWLHNETRQPCSDTGLKHELQIPYSLLTSSLMSQLYSIGKEQCLTCIEDYVSVNCKLLQFKLC